MSVQEITLDVRDLEPPEPYEWTTEVLLKLEPGQYVRMISRRRPRLLYPWLTDNGFCEETRKHGEEHYELFIWAKEDQPVADLITEKS